MADEDEEVVISSDAVNNITELLGSEVGHRVCFPVMIRSSFYERLGAVRELTRQNKPGYIFSLQDFPMIVPTYPMWSKNVFSLSVMGESPTERRIFC